MAIKGRNWRFPSLFLVTALLLCSQQPAATAHTKLLSANPPIVSANPPIGGEIDLWPTSITLEFDDQLQNLGDEKANFVVVNNAVGDQVSETDEQISGNTITVTLSANKVKGPVLVFFHVVASDGH